MPTPHRTASPRHPRRRIHRALLTLAAVAALALPATAGAGAGGAVDAFRPLASMNVPGGGLAEIVSATPDERTLVYTDAAGERLGLVDLADPRHPTQIGTVAMPGEPTSVTVTPDGRLALAVVRTMIREVGAPPVRTPGLLVAVDIATRTIVGSRELGEHPDSIALATIGAKLVAVVAIENEPLVLDAAGAVADGEDPGDPLDASGPGLLQLVELDLDDVAASAVVDVPLTLDAAVPFHDDPQPEFVAIRGARAAVSMQENNAIAIVHLAKALAGRGGVRIFPAGTAADRPADLTEDGVVDRSQTFPADVAGEPLAGMRFPDGLAWTSTGRIVSADEGEMDWTGSRGWTIFDDDGEVEHDDAGALEGIAVTRSHYPDARSEAKGLEVEGAAVARFRGGAELAFLGSERGSFIAVYRLRNGAEPRFVQLLPTGIGPEGILPLPKRGLLVATGEEAGTITVFKGTDGLGQGSADRPVLRSADGVPWGALSGLAGHPDRKDLLWAVPDDAYPSELYRIELDGRRAFVDTRPITDEAGERARLDLEGVAFDSSGAAQPGAPGWWVAQEGTAAFGSEDYRPNALIQLDEDGRILRRVTLPEAVDGPTGGVIRSNGFEGVTVSHDGRYLLAPIQREYAGDAAQGGVLHTRIARYDLRSETWDFFLYPLDPPPSEDAWIGLSEIVAAPDGRYLVIERDNRQAAAAAVKKIFAFSLEGVEATDGSPVPEGADLSGKVIAKEEAAEILREFAPFEKVEGLGIAGGCDLWAALDNDGGEFEPRLVRITG